MAKGKEKEGVWKPRHELAPIACGPGQSDRLMKKLQQLVWDDDKLDKVAYILEYGDRRKLLRDIHALENLLLWSFNEIYSKQE